MKRIATTFVVAAALSVSGVAPGSAEPVAPSFDLCRLAWLAGAWTGTQAGVEMEELWLPPKGGALVGMHRDVQNGRMVSWEFFRIATNDSGTFYFTSPRSAPPTLFRLVQMDDKRVVFENATHDFPQRIMYWLEADGVMTARIEGTVAGKLRGMQWRFELAK